MTLQKLKQIQEQIQRGDLVISEDLNKLWDYMTYPISYIIRRQIKESEEETKRFLEEQTNEDISNLKIYIPRSKKISCEMSRFLEGLK
jgi:hypothetical protein